MVEIAAKIDTSVFLVDSCNKCLASFAVSQKKVTISCNQILIPLTVTLVNGV